MTGVATGTDERTVRAIPTSIPIKQNATITTTTTSRMILVGFPDSGLPQRGQNRATCSV